jgi:hypothetical protein
MDYAEAMTLIGEIKQLDRQTEHTIDDLRRSTEIYDQAVQARRQQDRDAMRLQLEQLSTGQPHVAGDRVATTAFEALQMQGWKLGETAEIAPDLVLGKAIIDDVGDANPRREATIRPEGTDTRYLFPSLPTVALDGATRVDELVSTGRTLPTPISQTRQGLGGTAEKPTTASATTLESFDPEMIATVSDAYPNAIVQLPAFRSLVNDDLAVTYREGLDAHCVEALILGAGGSGNAGDDLVEQLRKAVTAIQGEGFDPRIAALSPLDAESLDLMRVGGSTTGDGPFLLAPAPRSQASSPLWNLEIRVVKNLPHPLVIDPAAVRLYVGMVEFASDPYSGFTVNTTMFRYEGPALCVVRQAGGVYVIDEEAS